MAATSREKLAGFVSSAKLAIDIPSKLESLHQLRLELPQEDPVLLTEFLPSLFDFHSDRFSPVRKFVTEYVSFHWHLFPLFFVSLFSDIDDCIGVLELKVDANFG